MKTNRKLKYNNYRIAFMTKICSKDNKNCVKSLKQYYKNKTNSLNIKEQNNIQ
jgi:hypothetical protein